MTSMLKNLYIDVLDKIVDEYSNNYHRKIIMKSVDFASGTYIDYNVDHNVNKFNR